MSLEHLKSLVPPPPLPREGGTKELWKQVESELGLVFPVDFRNLLDAYGTGIFDDFLWLNNPFAKNMNLNFGYFLNSQMVVLKELLDNGESIPFRLFPDPEGIVPWGTTENGDVLYWHTAELQNDWAVVVNESRGDSWESFMMPTTEFLLGIMTKKIRATIFPDDFPSEDPIFKPI